MMDRKSYVYRVQLQKETGEIYEKDCSVFWDPAKFGASEVAITCAAQESAASPMKVAGLTAVLQ